MDVFQEDIEKLFKKFHDQPTQFMSEEKKQQRPLMPIAMADKKFTVTTTGPYGGITHTDYTGTLELEGSFAVIREWEKGELIGIIVIPSHLIMNIQWKPAKTVKL